MNSYMNDFPFFQTTDPSIVYLDNAATTHKPQCVIDRVSHFYSHENSNVHRGIYSLGDNLTQNYEKSRALIAEFVNAKSTKEIIYTYGTTDAINLVASSLGDFFLKEGDEILLTLAEHHSNIVPWQLLAKRIGIKIRYIPLCENNRLDLKAAENMITKKTKVVSFSHVSNVTGVINPVKTICSWAKAVGAISLIDGAQGAPNLKVDVRDLGCDFYTFSGHKLFGPTGVGVLYGKESLLEKMPPYRGGGSMITEVSCDTSTWAPLPQKFEAGTPPIAQVLGLETAILYIKKHDRDALLEKERRLASLVIDELKKSKHIQIFNDYMDDSIGIVTFHHKYIHPHDMAALADTEKICIRAGHHCAQILMKHWKVPATSRLSFSLYNDEEDVVRFLDCFAKAEKMFTL